MMSRNLDPQMLIEAEKDMLPTRKEPNSQSFKDYLKEQTDYAKDNQDKRILLVIFCASHGFMKDGLQTLVMNQFDPSRNYFDLIPVEFDVRSESEKFPNIYSLVHYACCREIFKESKKLIKNFPHAQQANQLS